MPGRCCCCCCPAWCLSFCCERTLGAPTGGARPGQGLSPVSSIPTTRTRARTADCGRSTICVQVRQGRHAHRHRSFIIGRQGACAHPSRRWCQQPQLRALDRPAAARRQPLHLTGHARQPLAALELLRCVWALHQRQPGAGCRGAAPLLCSPCRPFFCQWRCCTVAVVGWVDKLGGGRMLAQAVSCFCADARVRLTTLLQKHCATRRTSRLA